MNNIIPTHVTMSGLSSKLQIYLEYKVIFRWFPMVCQSDTPSKLSGHPFAVLKCINVYTINLCQIWHRWYTSLVHNGGGTVFLETNQIAVLASVSNRDNKKRLVCQISFQIGNSKTFGNLGYTSTK